MSCLYHACNLSKQERYKFEAVLNYIVRPFVKKKERKQRKEGKKEVRKQSPRQLSEV